MEDWIGVAALAVATLALIIMLLKTRRRIARSSEEPGLIRRRNAEVGGMRRELDQLIVDIEAMCREVTARLDTKMRVLNELILQADRRIRELESLRNKKPAPQNAAVETPAIEPQKDSPAAPKTAPDSAPGNGAGIPQDGEEPFDADPRFARIFEMADAGADLVTIARETGMPKGEINLILSLRERKDK